MEERDKVSAGGYVLTARTDRICGGVAHLHQQHGGEYLIITVLSVRIELDGTHRGTSPARWRMYTSRTNLDLGK